MKHMDLRKRTLDGKGLFDGKRATGKLTLAQARVIDINELSSLVANQVTARGTYHPNDTIHDLGADNDAQFHHYWNLSDDHEDEYQQLRREGKVR